MTIIFTSINAQNLAQSGVKALNARQDKTVIMTGNVENVNYRKSVFPELRFWMEEVFFCYEKGAITKEEKINLFTFIRGKAVRGILNYRAKTAITMASQAKRIAELEDQLASQQKVLNAQAEVIKVQGEVLSTISSVANSVSV